MVKKALLKGNEAVAEAALEAGCKFYYGYPITPQTEIGEYLAANMPKRGGKFLQVASEIAAINRVYGAAAAGARVMTSSSGPGMSLKQEGISYLALAKLPCVIVDVMRGGPGLGNIQPSQQDYFQVVKGGGHGGYKIPVLAPSSVQEMYDLTLLAFDLADIYRTPVIVLADGALGQMMEPMELTGYRPPDLPTKDWALTGCSNRTPNIIVPFTLNPTELEQMNLALQKSYRIIEKNETRFEITGSSTPKILLVGYGFTARILKTVVKEARLLGIDAALLRPITLWPFPSRQIEKLARSCRKTLVVEMSLGQMVEDVRLAVNNRTKVHFYGRAGGMIPSPQEILEQVKALMPEVQ